MPRKPPSKPTVLSDAATQAVDRLRRFYDIGRQANEIGGGYGEGTSVQFAEQMGLSRARVDHARTFAKRIGEAEFESICEMRDANGRAFGPGHATQLMAVEDEQLRARLLSQWAKHGWTVTQLRDAIRGKLGKRSHGGRRRNLPATQKAAVEELQRVTRHWLDLYRGLRHPPENVAAALRGFPAALRKRLGTAADALTELQQSLGGDDVTGE